MEPARHALSSATFVGCTERQVAPVVRGGTVHRDRDVRVTVSGRVRLAFPARRGMTALYLNPKKGFPKRA